VTTLTFYFDPLCPWAWRASLWVRAARQQRPLEVQWRVFSLRANNAAAPVALPSDPALRTLVLARRAGGNEAVDRLYLALGRARHERREDLDSTAVLAAALQQAGLDPALAQQALDDPTTDQEVKAEHRAAVEQFDAYGVPWLVLEDRPFGFNGPVITEVPHGDSAAELWDHVSWLLGQPYFYELKRERR
jgi:protein-disulfide isomerase-like protein with CxxC motif